MLTDSEFAFKSYVWPDSDHWFSTLPPKGITSLAKPVLGFQEKTKYIHEKRLQLVVKETNNTYRTTGTALPTEQAFKDTQTGRYIHTRPYHTFALVRKQWRSVNDNNRLQFYSYHMIDCYAREFSSKCNKWSHASSPATPSSPTPTSPPPPHSVDYYLHILVGAITNGFSSVGWL